MRRAIAVPLRSRVAFCLFSPSSRAALVPLRTVLSAPLRTVLSAPLRTVLFGAIACLALTGCLVSTNATTEQASGLDEVSGVDVRHIPRASEAATSEGPRRPDAAAGVTAQSTTSSAALAGAATTDADTSNPDTSVESQATGNGDLTATPDSAPAGQQLTVIPDPTAGPETSAGPETTAGPESTAVPQPAAAPEATAVSEAPAATAVAVAPTTAPVPTAIPPAAATAVPAPTQIPQVNQVAAAPTGPVATDNLAVTESAVVASDGTDPVLSESGALACSIVELSLDELDRGDLADFGADMNTAAGFASAAPEPGLNALASSLPGAAASSNPIDVVGAFLTACATYGYEI